jgi:hypothetical protein
VTLKQKKKKKKWRNEDMDTNKSPYDFLKKKELEVWNNADDCDCDDQDCKDNHKICALCGYTVVFNAYEATQPTSEFRWNIDHIIPVGRFNELYYAATQRGYNNVNDIKNLQITHVECNEEKSDNFNSNFPNGFCKKEW